MRPACAFVIQNMAGERFKKHTKNNHKKSNNKCKKCGQKGRAKKLSLLIFWGLGQKAPQGGPKDPYKHPLMSNLIEICIKMVRIILFL